MKTLPMHLQALASRGRHVVAIGVALLSGHTPRAQSQTLQPGQWFSVVYSDSMRSVLLVNGGPNRGGKSPNAPVEIWSWDGSNWTLVAADSTGPRWRNYAIATYDSRRNVVVLFGGLQYGVAFDDTWEWNGHSWARRNAVGPGPRVSAEATFDKARGVTVMFGGNEGDSLLRDTWTWDGTKWSVLPSQRAGPSPRGSHTMVYDDERRVTLMYGGHFPSMTDGKNFSEFWEWNGTRWRLIESPAPTPGIRVNARAAYDPTRKSILLVGGADNSPDGVWRWDGSRWFEHTDAGFAPRNAHGLAFDAARNRIVMFGGIVVPGGSQSRDTWEWDGSRWKCMAGCTGPSF